MVVMWNISVNSLHRNPTLKSSNNHVATHLNPLSFRLSVLSKSSKCLIKLSPCKWLLSCCVKQFTLLTKSQRWVCVSSFFSSFCLFPDRVTVIPLNHKSLKRSKICQAYSCKNAAFTTAIIVLTTGLNSHALKGKLPQKSQKFSILYLLETNSDHE